MAGLFGMFNYAKPGKGVDKNAPQKHRFLFFFELLFRKFFKLIGLNIIYFVIIFPLMSYICMYMLSVLGIDSSIIENDLLIALFATFVFELPQPVVWILVLLSAVLFGPVTAGMTYILRNFAREEHAWVISDLWERSKANFKQALLVGILDIIIPLSFFMYLTIEPSDTTLGQFMVILKYVALVIFCVYELMRFYIYLILVTFDLKLSAIFKNAWLFVILGIVKNILIVLFCGIVIVLSISFFDFVVVPLLTFSLCGFIVVFNAYPTVKKFMIDPLQERDEDSEIELEYEDEDEVIFEDDVAVRNREKLEAEKKREE